jgi:hypothetical protein
MVICSMRDSRGCGTAKGRTTARDEYSTVDCSALLPFIYFYVLSACIYTTIFSIIHIGNGERKGLSVYTLL